MSKRGFARTFGQDLMRGEHNGWGGGSVKKPFRVDGPQSASLKGGLTVSTTTDPYRAKKRNRKANAQPSGGGGGGWKEMNEKMAATRAKKQGGLAIGTQDWVNGKIADGQIEGGMSANQSGTSIFDPVLCELSYRWFCPPGGVVLDPFAGGSVRGIVASKLGRKYVGVDLRAEQIAANEVQAKAICKKGEPRPTWHVGDSRNIGTIAKGVAADFVFSCPPYADLEVYSENPSDLSTLAYPEFRQAYFDIVKAACALLKNDRFATFVVGEVRDKDGLYYGFVPDTFLAFENAGLRLYNEAILVTAAGSLPIRAGKQFESTRKLGKTHQNFLTFVKGDPRKATSAIGKVEFGDFGIESFGDEL